MRRAAWSASIALSLLLAGCLGRTDEESEEPGRLAPGTLRLEEFPGARPGVVGLGYYCRLVSECGCPLLSPDDVESCRQEVTLFDEETCESMLYRAVPECLP